MDSFSSILRLVEKEMDSCCSNERMLSVEDGCKHAWTFVKHGGNVPTQTRRVSKECPTKLCGFFCPKLVRLPKQLLLLPMASKFRIKQRENGFLVGVIGDEDTITGFLLAGVGNVDMKKSKNFFVVTSKTKNTEIEHAFKTLTAREDLAVILITQWIANEIRHLLVEYDKIVPTILEIPSKDHPYDPEKDTVMTKVRKMLGVQ